MYYILSVGGMIIVRCTEYRGCPLLGGSLSINAMLNSIRVIDFVRCTEVVRFSECPLWEVPLYYSIIWPIKEVSIMLVKIKSLPVGRNIAPAPVKEKISTKIKMSVTVHLNCSGHKLTHDELGCVQ